MKLKISAFIITLNEAHNIEECMKTLSWADEIIIGDTGSTDNTTAIAKKITKKVYKIPFLGHAKSKELISKKAKNEWVFSFDADERVTKELRDEIFSYFNHQDLLNSIDGFNIPRKSFFQGQFMRCWYPGWQLRIYRKSKAEWNEENIHCGVHVKGKVVKLKNPFLHYTDPDIYHYLKKMNPYTTSDAIDLVRRKGYKKYSILNALGRGLVTFYKFYFRRKAILDGKAGFILSFLLALHNVIRYLKAYEFQKGITKIPNLEKLKSI